MESDLALKRGEHPRSPLTVQPLVAPLCCVFSLIILLTTLCSQPCGLSLTLMAPPHQLCESSSAVFVFSVPLTFGPGSGPGQDLCELDLNEVVNERWKELKKAPQGEQWELMGVVCRGLVGSRGSLGSLGHKGKILEGFECEGEIKSNKGRVSLGQVSFRQNGFGNLKSPWGHREYWRCLNHASSNAERAMGRFPISVEEKLRGDTDKRLSGEIREISKIRTNSKSIKSKNWWKSVMP